MRTFRPETFANTGSDSHNSRRTAIYPFLDAVRDALASLDGAPPTA
jgi:hypothetical protein